MITVLLTIVGVLLMGVCAIGCIYMAVYCFNVVEDAEGAILGIMFILSSLGIILLTIGVLTGEINLDNIP